MQNLKKRPVPVLLLIVASATAIASLLPDRGPRAFGSNRTWPWSGIAVKLGLAPKPSEQFGMSRGASRGMSLEERVALQAAMEAAMAPGNKLLLEANALFDDNKLEEAEQKYREAIAAFRAVSPTTGSSLDRKLADVLLARGKYKEALNLLGVNRPKSMRHIPGYPELCLRIAQCYLGLGNEKLARKFHTYAMKRYSARQENLPAASLRSIEVDLLMMRGREVNGWPEQALRYYQAAGKLAPTNLGIAEATGDTLYWLKRYDEAMPYFRFVLKQKGDKADYGMRMRVEMYDRRTKPQ